VCVYCYRYQSEWTYAKPKSCQNCQGIEPGQSVDCYITNFFKEPVCMTCGKFKSEWTYAPEPEPEKPCPNCQNVLSWMMVKKHPVGTLNFPIRQGTGWTCVLCNRPESEWTFTIDHGGIGGGGTGGPL
jgi:hypothetical protein